MQQEKVAANHSHEHIELRLSGLVTKRKGSLVPYNQIYKTIFNADWVTTQLDTLDSSSTAHSANNLPSPAAAENLPLPPTARDNKVLAAIVFTDVVSFTKKMAADERHTLSLIERDFELMKQLCHQYEGQILKSLGDGLLMYFASGDKATHCAIEIQKSLALAAANLPNRDILLHRIGIHLGEVFFSGSDVMEMV